MYSLFIEVHIDITNKEINNIYGLRGLDAWYKNRGKYPKVKIYRFSSY